MTVTVAIITSGCTLLGVIITAIANCISNANTKKKVAESADLTLYRIKQLEAKQDKHNTLVERMYLVENRLEVVDEKIKVSNDRIADLERHKV